MGAPEQAEFGNYQVLRRLGVGGMAEAFLAIRRGPAGFEQRVCLKRVLPAYASDPEFARMFTQEASLAASLHHGHIVGVIELGEVNGVYFMALELVDGVDMRTLLRQAKGGRLPLKLVALVANDLAYALDYAHTCRLGNEHSGLVHRDLSPSNVLVSYAGEVKLTDFGIAKAMRNAVHATATHSIKGKVPYMAPEQAQGLVVDGRSDLFSLGVLMYEALVGHRPFDGPTQIETMRRVMDGQHVPLGDAMAGLPPDMVSLVESLIAVDPSDRPKNAAEVVDALTELTPPSNVRRQLGNLVKEARPPGSVPPTAEGDASKSGVRGTASVESDEAVALAATETAPSDVDEPSKDPIEAAVANAGMMTGAKVVAAAADQATRTRLPGTGDSISSEDDADPSRQELTSANRPSALQASDVEDTSSPEGASADMLRGPEEEPEGEPEGEPEEEPEGDSAETLLPEVLGPGTEDPLSKGAQTPPKRRGKGALLSWWAQAPRKTRVGGAAILGVAVVLTFLPVLDCGDGDEGSVARSTPGARSGGRPEGTQNDLQDVKNPAIERLVENPSRAQAESPAKKETPGAPSAEPGLAAKTGEQVTPARPNHGAAAARAPERTDLARTDLARTDPALDELPPEVVAKLAEQELLPKPAAGHGRVSVVLIPWGKIWLDGKFAGYSPFNRVLKAGTYVLGGAQASSRPTHFHEVTVMSGETYHHVMRLNDPPGTAEP